MGLGRVVLVRRAIADVAVEDDERGAALRALEDLEGARDTIHVVGVFHALHVPAVTHEPPGHVLRERQACAALDGDAIVVVDPAQVVETQVTGQGCRLRRDPLHQAAVATHDIDAVIEDVEARAVVSTGEPLLADGHAHAGGDALAERAAGGLDARHPVILGVPRSLAVELAEVSDVVEGDRGLSQPLVVGVHGPGPGEMEDGPEQHRGVAVREHEAVAIGPDRISRVEAHHAVPERVDQWGERHRRAGMSGLCLLDGIDREGADGVDAQLIELRVGHGFCHPPDGDRRSSTALGPHVPGSYS